MTTKELETLRDAATEIGRVKALLGVGERMEALLIDLYRALEEDSDTDLALRRGTIRFIQTLWEYVRTNIHDSQNRTTALLQPLLQAPEEGNGHA